MIFDNMMLPDNTLPLDNIMSAQNASNLQSMMPARDGRMTPQTTTLRDMLAQQNAALTRTNGTTAGTTPAQNARSLRTTAAQNSTASSNRMSACGINAVAAMQSNSSGADSAAQVARQLAQSCFAVHEAVLYLDTHPDDQNALEYYRRKQQQLMQASEDYQNAVGPIRACTVDTSSGSWQWVETPWPWEIEEV